MTRSPVFKTDFSDLKLIHRGKVRDLYEVGDKLLMVATDRISAFDVVMEDPVPDKGAMLTQISLFWFDFLHNIIDNHLISAEVASFPEACRPYQDQLALRSMLVKKASPLPVECIVRGYITGSGWKEYQERGSISGISLPWGLLESERLLNPIFTPSTKAELGRHDENISIQEMEKLVGKKETKMIADICIRLYDKAAEYARGKGIIIADTKFELGVYEGKLILIDEVLTPDSSRFWPLDHYEPGRGQMSFDKQFLRDYLSSLAWSKQPPPPKLPPEIIDKTRQKYLEALERLTGKRL